MNLQLANMSLRDLLADPLIQAAMAADDVDPRELAIMLDRITDTLDRRTTISRPKRNSVALARAAA